MQDEKLLVIGIMTGNSLDGVDAVLCEISEKNNFNDIALHSVPYSGDLKSSFRELRSAVQKSKGDVLKTEKYFNSRPGANIELLQAEYLSLINQCVSELINKAGIPKSAVDLIGFHGQTCDHLPPSIAGVKDKSKIYTVQFGSGQALADLSLITVVHDFRSDDLMQLGEAAPFAPIHLEHLTENINFSPLMPVGFCNAGNTGNIAIVSKDSSSGKFRTLGWDFGPFNHFADFLMQKEKGKACDFEGAEGRKGRISLELLQALYEKAVITGRGENFLLKPFPKSSDPSWYKIIPEMIDTNSSFNDRLRTAEYFSIYNLCLALSSIQKDDLIPLTLVLYGGGWKNPLNKMHLDALLEGDYNISPVLQPHKESLSKLAARGIKTALSSDFGIDPNAMEARIFADAAVCRIKKEPFARPEITSAEKSSICGVLSFPLNDQKNASEKLKKWLTKHSFVQSPVKTTYWSRASAGWYVK